MKKQKMSLDKMKTVLNKVLSREEMKEVMAGSGPGSVCGACSGPSGWFETCYTNIAGACTGCGGFC